MSTRKCIRLNGNEEILVSANSNQVISLEGNYYFHPDCIDKTRFETSDRTYSCPEKGVCLWVDMKTGNHYQNDVAWVYPQTKKGYEQISGWYGFYSDHKLYYYGDCD